MRWQHGKRQATQPVATFDSAGAVTAMRDALATCPPGALGYADALHLICTATGWPVGHVWTAERGCWRPSGAWYDTGPQYAALHDATASTALGAGRGIVAAVLHLESCRFLPGLAGLGSAARIESAAAAGLRAVVGVPVHAPETGYLAEPQHHHVAAILEFACATEVEPDGALAQALLDVARRVRPRTHQAPRPPATAARGRRRARLDLPAAG